MARRLIIIGGGYLGCELARAMDNVAQVTLIEPRDAFCHSPALIRGVVRQDLVEKALFPYEHLLQGGQVLRTRAAAVKGDGVTLENGDRLCVGVRSNIYRSTLLYGSIFS